jgi:solute:Na+ symporter, SSS family
MDLHIIDAVIIAAYLVVVALIGFIIQKKASKQLDSYFLADRNIPWWMLGLSGCSSYIDIGGTMALVGALFYLGLKSIWMTHIFWGWFIICFYMAFQAKYIRRSGVMTFAEWNKTRFGENRDAEFARLAAAIFLIILMTTNLMYIAVGTGKFAEEFLPLNRWQSTLIVFSVVGMYVTMGGFFGVILTDLVQTVFIAVGAVILTILVFQNPEGTSFIASKAPEWNSLNINWTLWDGYLQSTPESYKHFYFFGPIMMAGFVWVIFRILAGPNVWDFQFFLTTRSPRDAQLAAGSWTLGYTLRWIIGCAFMILGIYYLSTEGASFDAEKIMPLVLKKLPVGMQGIFMAVLLAALMSTLSAMINVTSSVITNDFLKRYFAKNLSQKSLVNWARIASVFAISLGFIFSLSFDSVITAWETMIFVVVTMILVPSTFRWHWWRFSARAFVWGMILSALIITIQKIFFNDWAGTTALAVDVIGSFIVTLACGFYFNPTNMDVLVSFYSKVRPFGFWKPVREEAERRGLVPVKDKMPQMDILNGFITAAFQMTLAILPFYVFLRQWNNVYSWSGILIILMIVLYFTWYKNLPAKDEV